VRFFAAGRQQKSLASLVTAAFAALTVFGSSTALANSGESGGVSATYFPLPAGGVTQPDLGPQPGKTVTATIGQDGLSAVPPAGAPSPVASVIRAANRIAGRPYRWGGGHRRFTDSAYDCSGAVSFALRGANLVSSPLDSRAFMRWGQTGPGAWITVYANRGHAYVVIAGLRFDTSGAGGRGPRWRPTPRPVTGFTARHFPGL
jgi:cell wall-associated NlpC family hydrolase